MRRLVGLLMLAIVFAIAKAIMIGLAIALFLVLAYAFLTRPVETLLFIGVLALVCVAMARPTASIITLGVVSVVAMVADARAKGRRQPVLSDSREHH